MKPIRLEIKGLNSFIENQVVDFEKLTSKGLFGIFGPTGSGKSTILDAITLALYGKISRNSTNYINTNCDELIVGYEFEILRDGERKNYIAERCIKRDKHGSIKTKYARLVENKVNVIAEGPMEVNNTSLQIIGLNCDDFTRSVVLPQGKFSEFLSLKGKDRRNMLERIFALEKYGNNLYRKVASINKKYVDEKNVLIGKLKKYEDLTYEMYKEKNNEVKILNEKEELLKRKKEEVDKEYIELKELGELTEEIYSYKNRETILNEKQKVIDTDKVRLEKGKSSLKIKPFIEELELNKSNLENEEKYLLDINRKLDENKFTLKEIEDEFKKVDQEKTYRLPSLIGDKENVSRALELYKRCNSIKEEREKLVEQYKILRGESNTKENERKEIVLEIGNFEEQEQVLNKKIRELEYGEEEKDLLEEAVMIYREVQSKHELLKEKEEKEKEKKKNIESLKKDYEICLKSKKEISDKIDIEEEKKTDLTKNFPGHNNLLLSFKDEIGVLTEKVKNKEVLEEKIENLGLIIKEKSLRKVNLEEEVDNLQNKYKLLEEKYKAEEEIYEKLKIDNLSYIIRKELNDGDTCPVCGSIHYKNEVEEIDSGELEGIKYNLDNIRTSKEEVKEKLNSAKNNLIIIKREEEDLVKEINSYKEDSLGIGDLKTLKADLENKNLLFNKTQLDIENFEKEKNNLELNLLDLNKQKDKIFSSEAMLGERLNGEEKALTSLLDEIKVLKDALDNFIQKLEGIKREINVQNVEGKWIEIKENEKQIKRYREQVSLDIENKKKLLLVKENLTKEIGDLQSEMKSIEEVGKEKKSNIDVFEKEISGITKGEAPEKVLRIILDEIDRINTSYDKYKKEIETVKDRVKGLEDEFIKKNQIKEDLEKRCVKIEEQLNNLLKENDFINIKHCLESYISKEKLEDIENEIKSYEDEKSILLGNIKRVEDRLKGRYVEKEKIKEVKDKKETIETSLMETVREKATLEKHIMDIKKDLDELKVLRNEEKTLDHKLSLLDDIMKLFKGNKFVEFVAMNRLKYIAFEASKRLKDITCNRYALEIDGEGNFTIRDDMNGGVVRDCTTLSGGETFLTSLALALSLSSQIQLKGSSPLEFFFLDEGFGTLDSNLLEVVISSLEKLHNNKMSVGIISHVDELKGRVPIKLIVNPNKFGEGGTKVKIELS